MRLSLWPCTVKLFTSVIISVKVYIKVFVTLSHFHPVAFTINLLQWKFTMVMTVAYTMKLSLQPATLSLASILVITILKYFANAHSSKSRLFERNNVYSTGHWSNIFSKAGAYSSRAPDGTPLNVWAASLALKYQTTVEMTNGLSYYNT